MKMFLLMLTVATGLETSILVPVYAGDVEIPEVPSGHPRVYVRPSDVPEIRQKIETDEFKDSWESIKEEARRSRGYSILCKAFVYLITQDRDMGRNSAWDKNMALDNEWDNHMVVDKMLGSHNERGKNMALDNE